MLLISRTVLDHHLLRAQQITRLACVIACRIWPQGRTSFLAANLHIRNPFVDLLRVTPRGVIAVNFDACSGCRGDVGIKEEHVLEDNLCGPEERETPVAHKQASFRREFRLPRSRG